MPSRQRALPKVRFASSKGARIARSVRELQPLPHFDKRGTGSSDRMSVATGYDERADDLIAVLDDAEIERREAKRAFETRCAARAELGLAPPPLDP